MKITREEDYGVILMTHFASLQNTDPVRLISIAKFLNLPVPFVRRIASKLVKNNLLKSREGIKGGYMLNKPASAITIYDIVSAISPAFQLTKCSTAKRTCPRFATCSAKKHWQNLNDALITLLQQKTLDQIV